MEIGQIIHNNPVGLPCPDFADALICEIRDRLAMAYWNTQQMEWAGSRNVDPWDGKKRSYEPMPTGIEWRPYYNWGGSPEDADWDQAEADKPNFSFEGVEVRWYKRFGRSMNVNVCWDAERWRQWFDRCLQTIRAWEGETRPFLFSGDPPKYPDPQSRVPLDQTPDDLRHLDLMRQIETLMAQLNCIACVCIDVSDSKSPRFERDDWRWCQTLDWVTRLGQHALGAPGKLALHAPETD